MQDQTKQRKKQSKGFVNWKTIMILIVLLLSPMFSDDSQAEPITTEPPATMVSETSSPEIYIAEIIPAYSGSPYAVLNGNVPEFEDMDTDVLTFEEYGDLDELGRCTQAVACISTELMPTQERGNISQVKPTGWQRAEYDFIDGGLLYNRCHLIAHQLTGEDANEENLITGTRYMNEDGMNPFEILVGDYVRETGNRVLYRVTPVFEENELIARGVQMEAWSIEDDGEGICFNIFCYNVQPGIGIDYTTGDNWIEETICDHEPVDYVLNTNSMKYHLTTCSGISDISEENLATFTGCYETLEDRGYMPCGNCQPNA